MKKDTYGPLGAPALVDHTRAPEGVRETHVRPVKRFNPLYLAQAIGIIYVFLWFCLVCHMMPGQGGGNPMGQGGSFVHPPQWDPAWNDRLPFRRWARKVQTWSMAVDLPPSRKANLIVLALQGQAQRLAESLPPQALIQGGLVNGHQVNAFTYLMHTLAERYAPLGEETRLKAMTDIIEFKRMPGAFRSHTFESR